MHAHTHTDTNMNKNKIQFNTLSDVMEDCSVVAAVREGPGPTFDCLQPCVTPVLGADALL